MRFLNILNVILFLDVALELRVGAIELVIHNNKVVCAWHLAELDLGMRMRQPLLEGLGRLGAALREALFEGLKAGRRNKDVLGGQLRFLHALDALHIDVEDADAAGLRHILHGLNARAVVVTAELRPLNELLLVNKLLELVDSREVVLHTVLLARARLARRVRHRKAERVGEIGHELVQKRGLASAAGATQNNRTRHLCLVGWWWW